MGNLQRPVLQHFTNDRLERAYRLYVGSIQFGIDLGMSRLMVVRGCGPGVRLLQSPGFQRSGADRTLPRTPPGLRARGNVQGAEGGSCAQLDDRAHGCAVAWMARDGGARVLLHQGLLDVSAQYLSLKPSSFAHVHPVPFIITASVCNFAALVAVLMLPSWRPSVWQEGRNTIIPPVLLSHTIALHIFL